MATVFCWIGMLESLNILLKIEHAFFSFSLPSDVIIQSPSLLTKRILC